MHDLDVYFEAVSVFWALVPAYFALAFLADERAPRPTQRRRPDDAPLVELPRYRGHDTRRSTTEPIGAPGT